MNLVILGRVLAKAVACGVFLVGGLCAASLDSLAARADAIVVGSVGVRAEIPDQVDFTINISRSLLGDFSGSTVNVVHKWAGLLRGAQTINQPLFGIWFLKKLDANSWDVLTARPAFARLAVGLFIPALPSAPSGAYSYSADTPLIDVLTLEMAAGLQATNDGLGKAWLLGVVDSMNTPTVTGLLGSLLSSGDTDSQAVGLAGSLERSQQNAIGLLAGLWPALSGSASANIVIQSLRNSWRDTTPTAVSQLVLFTAGLAKDSAIRPAAIRALAAVHTLQTLPFLASLLASSDINDKERAIYGLSAFANGCAVQTSGNAVTMDYLKCEGASQYKTEETIVHFAFRLGTPAQENALAFFWGTWWSQHPELD